MSVSSPYSIEQKFSKFGTGTAGVLYMLHKDILEIKQYVA